MKYVSALLSPIWREDHRMLNKSCVGAFKLTPIEHQKAPSNLHFTLSTNKVLRRLTMILKETEMIPKLANLVNAFFLAPIKSPSFHMFTYLPIP